LIVKTDDLSGGPDNDSGGDVRGSMDRGNGMTDALLGSSEDPSVPEASEDSTAPQDSAAQRYDAGAADSTAVDSPASDVTTSDTGGADVGIPVDTGSPDTGTPDAGGGSVCAAGGARVFVTNAGYTGNLGGLAGADQLCTSAAVAAGLGGTWNAWLSDSNNSALNRIYKVNGGAGYVLVNGAMVAANYASLISSTMPLLHAIDTTETGTVATGNVEVWTGTDLTGISPPGFCATGSMDWTSASSSAGTPFVGLTNQTNASWSDIYQQFCDRTTERLYCFERCP
jgi:hypothetical protein